MVLPRSSSATVTLYAAELRSSGSAGITLGADIARHLRALRLDRGAEVTLTDGAGASANATLIKVSSGSALFEIGSIDEVERAAAIHALVPVGDKDRMLLLAEKLTEFGVASWRPVVWRRSRSVMGRGEGAGFRRRLLVRMIAALCQSHGSWLPDIFPECNTERAVAAAPAGTKLILHQHGDAAFPASSAEPVVFAVGPEGGMEESELAHFQQGGFSAVRIAGSVLRFETAGIAGAALALAALQRGTGKDGQQ